MVKKVYLIRHGHIDNGNKKRYLGRTDVPLDALGLEQARVLHDYFKEISIDAVFTSPLKRCLQTSQILCEDNNITYKIVEALSEIDMGEWENVPMEKVKVDDAKSFEQRGQDIEHFAPPLGESFGALSHRVLRAFDEIIASDNDMVMIVAHAGVNRVILRKLLGISFDEIFTIELPYASVYELGFSLYENNWKCNKIL